MKKVWERVPTPKTMWERRSHAVPPYYTPEDKTTLV